MPTLLFVESSPRDAASASTTIANAFVDAWTKGRPGGRVDRLDVWDGTLPEFDGDALAAKYAALRKKEPTPEQARAWETVVAFAERFRQADVIVFSVPMWNYGIPYKLKQLIDVVAQNGLLFDFHDDASVTGRLGGKKTLVVQARGSFYDAASPTPADPYDQLTPFLRTWFRVVGLDDVTEVIVEKTLLVTPDELAAAVTAKSKEAAALAERF